MKKRNNQGFTLIEMMMVVAVIAVLVSIIVPKVSNSSNRSAAAADAANLRAAQSAIATRILEGEDLTDLSAETLGVPGKANCKGTYTVNDQDATPGEFQASIEEDGTISVSYGDFTIAMLSDIADNGKLDNSSAANPGAADPK